MHIKKGNLLTSNCDIIVQQCNCVTIKSHGLSNAINNKYPYADMYSQRKAKSGNMAKTADTPGTCKIMVPHSPGDPHVACLLGQYYPGKSGNYWSKSYTHVKEYDDSTENRLLWFEQALDSLENQLANDYTDITTVGFPYNIGCGLAGGDWKKYRKLLEEFAENNNHLQIIVYQL